MAGEDEDYGSARITLTLDETGVDADAVALAARIEHALDRGTRGVGETIRRNIQTGLDAAAVSVRVDPDLTRFDTELLAGLQSLDSINVGVTPDMTGFEAALRADLTDLSVTAKVNPSTTGFQAALRAGLMDLSVSATVNPKTTGFATALRTALRDLSLNIKVKPNLTGFDRGLVDGLAHIDAIDIPVRPDLRGFDRALVQGLADLDGINIPVVPDTTGFAARLQAELAGLEISVRIVPDFTGFDDAIRAHPTPDVTVQVNADVNRDRLTQALGGINKIATRAGAGLLTLLKLGAIGILAIGAASGVAKFVAALAPAVGILAAVPAVVFGFAGALGALKLALSGVGDAFKAALSGNSKQFEKSLDGLSPKAKAAARDVRAMKPAFDALKKSVQDEFFGSFEGQITATARALQGPLKNGLTAVAAGWGDATRGVLDYVRGSQGVANVRSILTASSKAVGGLSDTTNKLTAGLLQVAAVVSDAFGGRLSDEVSSLGQRFGTWLQTIAQGGKAVSWVNAALDTFSRLGSLVGNIGRIFSSVWHAADDAGAGFLGRLQTITGAVANFLKSAAGQSALGNIFNFLGKVAQQVGPIVGALLTQLGGIAPGLAPLLLIGPLLVKAVNAAGAAVKGALPDLGIAFGNLQKVVVSLLPALPPLALGFAALVRSAADLLVPLAPVAVVLAKIIGPIADYAAPVLVAAAATLVLVNAIRNAILIFRIVSAAWEALNLVFAASPIGVIIVAVIALVAAIYLLYTRFQVVRTVIDAVGNALRVSFLASVAFVEKAAAGIADFFVSAFESTKSAVSTGVNAVVGFFTALPGRIEGGLSDVGSAISGFFVGAFESAKAAVLAGTNSVVGFFVALPGRLLAGLVALPGLLYTAFVDAVAFAIVGLLTAIAGLLFIFLRLPTDIANGLVSLGFLLAGAFTTAFTVTLAAVTAFGLAVVAFFVALPGEVVAAASSFGGLVAGLFNTALNATTTTLTSWGTATISFFTALPGQVGGALAATPGVVGRAFESAGSASLNAVTSFGSSAISLFASLPGRAGGALASLGSRVGGAISSAAGAAYGAAGTVISGLAHVFTALPGQIVRAIGNVGGDIAAKVRSSLPAGVAGMLRAGADLVAGLVKGIASGALKVASTAKNLASSAVHAITGFLDSHSPSRVMIQVGKDVGAGFVIGMTGTVSQIAATGQKLATAITNAFKGKKTTVDDRLVALVQAGNVKLQSLAKQRDTLAQKISDAQKFASDTTSAALGAFSLQNLTQGVTEASTSTIVSGLKGAVAKVKGFTAEIAGLAKRGLSKTLLQELVGLGPDQGAALAKTLSQASAGTLKQINTLQGQLGTASARLGNISADALFDAGKRAGDGFLAGLKAQQKSIGQLMVDIAKSMQTAIRTALKIRSPSQVFRAIGDLTGAGLHLGLMNRIGSLVSAARRAAAAVVDSVAGQFRMMPGSVPALGGIGGGGGTVLPLTRAQRSRDDQGPGASGAAARGRRGSGLAGATITNHWTIREVGNSEVTAQRVLNRLVLAAGVG